MQSARPKTLVTITILLIILALGSLTTPLMSAFRAIPANGQPGNPPGGNFQRNNDNQGNNPNFQGEGHFQPRNGNSPQRSSGLTLFSLARTLGLGGQVMIYINYGIAALGLGLSLLAAFWVWKGKKAGLNLAMVLAIFFLLGSVGGVFAGLRMMNATTIIRYAINLYNVGASLVILTLGILPSVRDEVS